ncbi:hypothetical protein FAIPA1_20406 [Frankia sp. AiPs1]|uniref:asparagine synthase-related protein n=1 Tax=Frankia sp. AiPa1 TaxID=573492 RepID=UPI00202B13FD|nr:asparagine synthase-related protein [Frankia sp. AiPa1]MCL9759016.1 asparagine synthase-related protein [Frankia sp. AiPa1]
MTAGPCGTAPIYLAADGATLHGSWDMADLRSHVPGLSVREAARLLTFRPRYGSETLFEGIYRLTERATAHYGGARHISYPPPALHLRPRELTDSADVLGAFRTAIDTALDLRPLDQDSTVWHLTGGFDSGVIATRAAQRWPDQLDTAALLIAGPGRAQQARRREQMRSRLAFSPPDTVVDAAADPPLHPACARMSGAPISPYEEPLYHPFHLLAQALSGQGTRVVITGLGGDEMVAVSREEFPLLDPPISQVGRILPWVGKTALDALPFADDATYLYSTCTHPAYRTTHPGTLIARWAVDHAARQGRRRVRRGCYFPGLVTYYQQQGFALRHTVERTHRTVYLLARRAEQRAAGDRTSE